MRHGDKINNLGRKTAHRKALLHNLTTQLIEHKRIFTTLAKAKALRVFAEPIITRGKVDSTHNRRIVFGYLQSKSAVTELFTVVGDKIASRPGGYTRIIKMPRRLGDAADMAMIELVDFNDLYTKESTDTAKKTRRSRRGTGTAAPKAAAPAATPVTETETEAAPAPEAEAENMDTTVDAPAAEETNNETAAEGTTEA